MTSAENARVLTLAREAGVELVYLQFMDIVGSIKAIAIPVSGLESALERGSWFDGSAVYGAARIAEGDLYLHPDPSTFVLVPWESGSTARLICGLYGPDGEQFPADPRHALQVVLNDARDMGYDYRVSCEVEFFLFADGGERDRGGWTLKPVDRGGYFDVSDAPAKRVCAAATRALTDLGFDAQAMHHEAGLSQYEIDVSEMGALEVADAIVSLKWMLRAFARRDGLRVSFMPRPLAEEPGSGLHMHQVLYTRSSGANAFVGADDAYDLSAVAKSFVAGQLAHARGMCAILAPLVNSYKRLGDGDEAPSSVCWARSNRSALIRIPEGTRRAETRVELRAADPSCNPYLAFAACLRTGLDGITNGLALPDPMEQLDTGTDAGDLQQPAPLPTQLGEALEELDWDPVVRSALGHPIYEQFLAAKEQEWASYRRHISSWELDHYLDNA